MLLPDVNVLVYAHRADAPEHGRYADWLRRLATGSEPFGLSELGASGFVRVVADAYQAALAIEHGCEPVTADGDFARFAGLRFRHPLA